MTELPTPSSLWLSVMQKKSPVLVWRLHVVFLQRSQEVANPVAELCSYLLSLKYR